MCRQRMFNITVRADQFDSAHDIIDEFYERGEIERISVNHDIVEFKYQIWLECSTDDYESIKQKLQDNQIELL